MLGTHTRVRGEKSEGEEGGDSFQNVHIWHVDFVTGEPHTCKTEGWEGGYHRQGSSSGLERDGPLLLSPELQVSDLVLGCLGLSQEGGEEDCLRPWPPGFCSHPL